MMKHNYGDVVLCILADKNYHAPVCRFLTERVVMRKTHGAWVAEIKTARIPRSVLDGVDWQIDLLFCDLGEPIAMGAFALIEKPPTMTINPPTMTINPPTQVQMLVEAL